MLKRRPTVSAPSIEQGTITDQSAGIDVPLEQRRFLEPNALHLTTPSNQMMRPSALMARRQACEVNQARSPGLDCRRRTLLVIGRALRGYWRKWREYEFGVLIEDEELRPLVVAAAFGMRVFPTVDR